MRPKISICIPAYNRPEELGQLLQTAVDQDYGDYEIVVCEDCSPKAAEILAVVNGYIARYPDKTIRFFQNEENLGYDGNLRRLLAKAAGDFCFFMGDDDLICPGAIRRVAEIIERHEDLGVILRAYCRFDPANPEIVLEGFHYFPEDRFFPPGVDTIVTFFRRSTTIGGYTVNRAEALKCDTDRFDGTLLYQLYLSATILTRKSGYYISDALVKVRSWNVFYFGSSDKEKGRFVPRQLAPEHSLNFMTGMVEIAKYVEETYHINVYDRILQDYGNYSYPILVLHAEDLRTFMKYSYELARLGLWKSWPFYFYVIALMILKPKGSTYLIRLAKRLLGYTPHLGSFSSGIPVKKLSG